MKEIVLNINEASVTDKPVLFTCYGLGSCIGLFMSDRLKNLSGGAHILLPESTPPDMYQDAPLMIEQLVKGFRNAGSNLRCLRAKITGGANVLSSACNVGSQNVHVVVNQLIQHKVFIAAQDVGGSLSRTARFDSTSGLLKISKPNHQVYYI